MKKYMPALLVCAVLLFISPGLSPAQYEERSLSDEKTSAPADSRFEIIQSTIAAKVTLLLDKYTGNVSQFVLGRDNKWTWQTIERLKHPQDSNPNPNKVNYQIFTSGIGVRYTFLLNVNTGATWLLAEDTLRRTLYWNPIVLQ